MFMDEEDPFSSIISQEREWYDNARMEGEKIGEELAKKEAYQSGYQSGSDLADEIGYYMGIIETLQINVTLFKSYAERKEKIDKLFDELQAMIISLDTTNAGDPDLPNKVEKIRTKFKMLSSLLKMKVKSNDKDF
eukprot:CAMPEP_0176452570 /NCGR_PEP_ID=MMETSP0127-20121128/28624_1 /TAXON_ID=938130 /ORGANISM="Platyophrya macrostoma, Strain WH" /LENGTH=134 /DNA_ID=CAMNT_0017841069 /DNA_START=25 /DNA_END=429 /DNA_ORIENTATION=-